MVEEKKNNNRTKLERLERNEARRNLEIGKKKFQPLVSQRAILKGQVVEERADHPFNKVHGAYLVAEKPLLISDP